MKMDNDHEKLYDKLWKAMTTSMDNYNNKLYV